MSKTLWIDIKEARAALQDKSRLDALCLNLKVKFMFTSSALIFTNYKDTAACLHMGKAKLKRVLADAVTFGYFRKETLPNGDVRYTATKIHDNKSYAYKADLDMLRGLTFPQLKNLLRRAVLENHISMIEGVLDTHVRGTNPSSLKDARKMKARERRMLSKPFNDEYTGLSYWRIADLLGVSRRKACQIVSEMCARGDIRKTTHCVEFGCDPRACTYTHSYIDATGCVIVISAKYRQARLVCRNTYSCLAGHVGVSNNGTND